MARVRDRRDRRRRSTTVDNWNPPRPIDDRLVGEATFELRGDLALGYHHLRAEPDGAEAAATVIVTPARLSIPKRMGARRVWGWRRSSTACARSVRGRRDVADLADPAVSAPAEHGARFALGRPDARRRASDTDGGLAVPAGPPPFRRRCALRPSGNGHSGHCGSGLGVVRRRASRELPSAVRRSVAGLGALTRTADSDGAERPDASWPSLLLAFGRRRARESPATPWRGPVLSSRLWPVHHATVRTRSEPTIPPNSGACSAFSRVATGVAVREPTRRGKQGRPVEMGGTAQCRGRRRHSRARRSLVTGSRHVTWTGDAPWECGRTTASSGGGRTVGVCEYSSCLPASA